MTSTARAREPYATPGANVIFIQMDTVRFDHTSLAGYQRDTTPYLKKLAARGVLFTQTVSLATWCVPGTISLLTGLSPSHHGVANKFSFPKNDPSAQTPTKLAATVRTMPELLKARGYKLAAFTGQQTMDTFTNLDSRFELFPSGTKLSRFSETAPAALRWMEKHRNDRFFVFLHGYDPHGATDPTRGYHHLYDRGYKGPYHPTSADYLKLRDNAWANKEKRGSFRVDNVTPADKAYLTALYDERLHAADAELERFMKRAEALHLLDNTIVVIVSDHGEEMFDRGAIGHGQSLHDELIHVPMLMIFPHAKPMTVKQLVRNVDAMPTVLDALGVAPPHADGVSLLPLLRGKPLALQAQPETDFLTLTRQRGVRTSHYKFVHIDDSETRELYDLDKDPLEKHDISASRTDLVSQFERLLRGGR